VQTIVMKFAFENLKENSLFSWSIVLKTYWFPPYSSLYTKNVIFAQKKGEFKRVGKIADFFVKSCKKFQYFAKLRDYEVLRSLANNLKKLALLNHCHYYDTLSKFRSNILSVSINMFVFPFSFRNDIHLSKYHYNIWK